MNPIVQFDIVLVHWEDSCTRYRWESLEEYQKMVPSHCVTVGYLIKEDDDCLVIATSLEGDDKAESAANAMCIPRSAIKKMETIRRAS